MRAENLGPPKKNLPTVIFIVDCESEARFDKIFSIQPVDAHSSIFCILLMTQPRSLKLDQN